MRAGHAGDFGVEDARHADVDQKHGAARTPGKRLAHVLGGDHVVRGGARCDDHVDFGERGGQFLGGAGAAPQFFGEGAGPLGGAVDHQHVLHACRPQVGQSQLGGFARPQNQGAALRELTERGLREFHGGARHADHLVAQAGVRAHPLARRERALHHLVHQGAAQTALARTLPGAFDLSLNLGFADDQTVEPRRHAVEVTHGGLAPVHVEVIEQRVPPGALKRGKRLPVHPGEVDLGAVAGGEQQHLVGVAREVAEQRAFFLGPHGDALADLDRRGLVVEADHHEIERRGLRHRTPGEQVLGSGTRERHACASSRAVRRPRGVREAENRSMLGSIVFRRGARVPYRTVRKLSGSPFFVSGIPGMRGLT